MWTLAILLIFLVVFQGRYEGCIKIPFIVSIVGAFKIGKLCLLTVSIPQRQNRVYYRLGLA